MCHRVRTEYLCEWLILVGPDSPKNDCFGYFIMMKIIHTLYSWNFFSCVKDCVMDMVTFIALVKILSLENYYNTKIARLGENFNPRQFLVIQYYPLVSEMCSN